MNFLKNILATLLALIIFFGFSFFLFIGILTALSDKEKYEVKENSILHIKLNKPISEMEIDNPFDELGGFGGPSTIGLVELKNSIRNAAGDDKIKGIYLDVTYFMGGMATLKELREELNKFKESGKFIYAYSEFYTEGAYYLASVADKVYLNPEGELELNGLNANVTFFKGMLDKFGIEAQIFRVGEFKSAVEPFMRKDLSEANELQLKELLNGLNNTMLQDIATSRAIALERLNDISDKMEARESEDAKNLKLVDDLIYYDQFLEIMNAATDGSSPELVSHNKYKTSYSTYKSSTNKIAVIVAEGDIVMGKGEEGSVGSDKFAKLIREAREDDGIKAIIIRVNSPGGAYIASDVMWREIELAKKVKPVIASMSDYAASGGYYLSMPCDTIVAQPNTVTGSIGIFGMLFNFSGLLEDKLGITNDDVSTGEFSGMMTVTRSLTDVEKSIIQKSLEKNYDTFISKAAAGRGMSKEDLLAVASGRVWTGEQAKEKGLVDVLGTFEDAVSIAAAKANLGDDYKLRYYPESKPFFEKLMEDLGQQAKVEIVKSETGELYPYLKSIEKIKSLRGVQARMPYELEIN